MQSVDNNLYWPRFEGRCELRRLPAPIRRLLARVRNPYHLAEALKLVTSRVDETATRDNLARRVGSESYLPRSYVPAIHLRRIHRQLVKDTSFLAQVHNAVDDLLADANRDRRLEVGARGYPTRLPDCRPPASGPWMVRSDLGFGLASQFEAKPEGFGVGNAQRAWERLITSSEACLDEDAQLRVLDFGSFGGITAHTLAATKPSYAHVSVFESDSIGETTDLPFVSAAEDVPEADLQAFDLIVIGLPPPGKAGQSQYRNRFKASEAQKHEFDFGNVGPTRWRSATFRTVKTLALLLAERGELVLSLPESLRADREYEPAPQLLDGVRESIEDLGLLVTHDVEIVESHPVPQPFVGTNRPQRRCIIARRAAAADEGSL